MDPYSRAPTKITSHGYEVVPQNSTHLIQRPCYQRVSTCQDPAGNLTTRRPDHREETQTAVVWPRSRELRTQKLKSHLVRTQSLNVLPLKPGVGQYIAIHATHTARDFFLAYFYPSGPFTCIFSKTSPNFFLCWPAE